MNYLKPFVIFSFFICIAALTKAQSDYNYIPIKDDAAFLSSARRAIANQYDNDSLSIKGENRKYILELYRDRYKNLDDLFNGNQLIATTEANVYLNNIAKEIISKNPELKSLSPRFFFSRDYIQNAYSAGEGTIIFNISLFSRLANESQVAFVVCHELAHLYLNHSNKKIEKYINTVYADDFQKKLKQLQKQQYDKKAALDKLELGFTFKHLRHSRDFEDEADSAGLVFLSHTSYNCAEAINCLSILDSIDEEKVDIESKLPALFSFTEYPFKTKWIKKEDAFFGGVSNEKKPMEDSLKTHPDCKNRIEHLKPMLEKISSGEKKTFLQQEQVFKQLQTLFQFEVINHCLKQNKISRCLFNSIKLNETYPGNAYLVTTIGNCLNEMSKKQSEHELYKIIELPSPYREVKYNTLLEFISRLSLTDINYLGHYFLKQYANKFAGNSTFEKALKTSEQQLKATASK